MTSSEHCSVTLEQNEQYPTLLTSESELEVCKILMQVFCFFFNLLAFFFVDGNLGTKTVVQKRSLKQSLPLEFLRTHLEEVHFEWFDEKDFVQQCHHFQPIDFEDFQHLERWVWKFLNRLDSDIFSYSLIVFKNNAHQIQDNRPIIYPLKIKTYLSLDNFETVSDWRDGSLSRMLCIFSSEKIPYVIIIVVILFTWFVFTTLMIWIVQYSNAYVNYLHNRLHIRLKLIYSLTIVTMIHHWGFHTLWACVILI